ncbi:MAG: carbamoyltransferase HypF [Magnetococcales bacterium]|nr:carbamoyltransferase HypF [Magnetococcales bacterium]
MYQPQPATTLRLARPLKRSVLAMGVETKNAIALGRSREITLFPMVGDLADPDTRMRLERGARALLDGEFPPEVIAVDLHPDMYPTVFGRQLARERGLPVIEIQHHSAHAAACMAEHGLQEGLALSLDGMGWGTDGTLWGAELLQMTPGRSLRLGTFAPVPLPGGDAAVRHPDRQLVARWLDAGVAISDGWRQRHGLTPGAITIWTEQWRRRLNAPMSHAAGRLFDAFAALLGIAPGTIGHEGEPAMLLEAEARRFHGILSHEHRLPYALGYHDGVLLVDWAETFRQFPPEKCLTPEEVTLWAYAFHLAVASAIQEMVQYAHQLTGLHAVALSGGVFMNGLLKDHLIVSLEHQGFQVFCHRQIPVGDGSVAVGQAWMIGEKE